jgi:hypothetical protein
MSARKVVYVIAVIIAELLVPQDVSAGVLDWLKNGTVPKTTVDTPETNPDGYQEVIDILNGIIAPETKDQGVPLDDSVDAYIRDQGETIKKLQKENEILKDENEKAKEKNIIPEKKNELEYLVGINLISNFSNIGADASLSLLYGRFGLRYSVSWMPSRDFECGMGIVVKF